MVKTNQKHPIFARLYPQMSRAMERGGMAERRGELLAGLSGTVLEIGAGSGDNFGHYPSTVTRVLAVEPEPHLRQLARRAAEQAPVTVEVVDGVADHLPAQDETIDAAVACLVLCTVPDPETALSEIRRVLRPRGELRFLEHVRADTRALVRIQLAMDATLWPRLAGGCHTARDTASAITRAGFTIDRLDHFLFPEQRSPVSFHIYGTATRPRPNSE